MQSHIRRVHACLAVTCHLHFWQNATARIVTAGSGIKGKRVGGEAGGGRMAGIFNMLMR